MIFVNCTVRWMVKDGKIQSAILTQLHNNPESDTSDILEVLCDCLGLGEPLEIVDDDGDFQTTGNTGNSGNTGSTGTVETAETVARITGMARAAY